MLDKPPLRTHHTLLCTLRQKCWMALVLTDSMARLTLLTVPAGTNLLRLRTLPPLLTAPLTLRWLVQHPVLIPWLSVPALLRKPWLLAGNRCTLWVMAKRKSLSEHRALGAMKTQVLACRLPAP